MRSHRSGKHKSNKRHNPKSHIKDSQMNPLNLNVITINLTLSIRMNKPQKNVSIYVSIDHFRMDPHFSARSTSSASSLFSFWLPMCITGTLNPLITAISYPQLSPLSNYSPDLFPSALCGQYYPIKIITLWENIFSLPFGASVSLILHINLKST